MDKRFVSNVLEALFHYYYCCCFIFSSSLVLRSLAASTLAHLGHRCPVNKAKLAAGKAFSLGASSPHHSVWLGASAPEMAVLIYINVVWKSWKKQAV